VEGREGGGEGASHFGQSKKSPNEGKMKEKLEKLENWKFWRQINEIDLKHLKN
jgi:hypothetical protein